jgi:hypothetical protein
VKLVWYDPDADNSRWIEALADVRAIGVYFLNKPRKNGKILPRQGRLADAFPNFVNLKSGTGQQLNIHESSYDAECSWACGSRGLFPPEIDRFSHKRKRISWDRQNDQLAPTAGPS